MVIPGWLSSLDTFPYQKVLQKYPGFLSNHSLHFVHFSNFGRSPVSPQPQAINNYLDQIKTWQQQQNTTIFPIISHSAGSRLAATFASHYPKNVLCLALVSPGGLTRQKASQTQISRAHYYFSKFRPSSSEKLILQTTFKNLYNLYLKNDLKKISCPTKIFWGAADRTIPAKRLKRFQRFLPQVIFTLYPRFGHMLLQKPEVFGDIFEFIHLYSHPNV